MNEPIELTSTTRPASAERVEDSPSVEEDSPSLEMAPVHRPGEPGDPGQPREQLKPGEPREEEHLDKPAGSASPSSGGAIDGRGGTDMHWRQLAVACLGLLALLNGALALYAFSSLHELRSQITDSLWRSEQRYEALDAQIQFDSRRRQLLLGLRDEILAINPSLDWAEAYRYAALAVSASERYTSVDPVLLVSIGIVESGYDNRAQSVAGARGLYQIFPSTARLLSRSLGWEYTDETLYQPDKNTEMASLYLETLFAAHDDPTVALAEYREGALSAGYLQADVRGLDPESERYLSSLTDTYARLVAKHGTLRGTGETALLARPGEAKPRALSVPAPRGHVAGGAQ